MEAQKQFVSPIWSLALWALGELGLPSDADRKRLKHLQAAYDAAAARLGGLSHDDARATFKAAKRAVSAGELKAAELFPWPAVKERFALQRAAVRNAMLAPSREAAQLVAGILESATPQLPALAANIHKREIALTGVAITKKSELILQLEAMPKFLELRAKQLRASNTLCPPNSHFES